jgi:thiamine-phosphate pyrophosphorylase
MDHRLVAWARAVKSRNGAAGPPSLWMFTDHHRLPDPLPAIARLPRGLAGVVFRPEGVADPRRMGRAVARLCRARRLVLVVAGNWRLAADLGAKMHLRGGRAVPGMRRRMALTSSAHGMAELVRARRAGVMLSFLSPVFATQSHPGAMGLGPTRWAAMARRSSGAVAALGGITGGSVRQMPRTRCKGVGAIGALVA